MLVLIDKPTGFTSFDIVKKLKRVYQGEKIGHAGTLDPLATGLLLVAIGKDTKKIDELVGMDKSYEATIDFSQLSDTWDSDARSFHEQLTTTSQGVIIHGVEKGAPALEDIENYLQSILGIHLLPLTPFSAKKRKGKKLYEYAREGNPVYIDTPMELISYEVLSYTFPLLQVRLQVGSGTYIRSIAHWLGEKLGMGGILVQLKRTQIGPYSLEMA